LGRFDLSSTYDVIVEQTAKEDARAYAEFIKVDRKEPAAAAKWLDELESAIGGLSEMPERYSVIPEQTHFSIELRQVIHYSHRVIFHVNEAKRTVHVLRVFHSHRDGLTPSDAAADPQA
jgi:plasmid stabilization system protein ParE